MARPTYLGPGRWRVRVYVGLPGCRELTRVVHTPKATDLPVALAEAELRDQRDELKSRAPDLQNIVTVGDLVGLLLAEPPPTWSNRHRKQRQSLYDKHLAGTPLDGRRFADRGLTPMVFEAHINSISAQSRQTRQHLRGLIHEAYREAIRRGLWSRESPVAHIRVLGASPKARKPPEAEQVADLLAYTNRGQDPYWECLLLVALGTGARRGELAALPWLNVDLESKEVKIDRAVKDAAGTIGPPKTSKGYRTIRIPPMVADRLTQWQADATALAEGELPEFVFYRRTRGGGASFDEPAAVALISRWYLNEIKPLIGDIDFHALRHWFSSVLRAGDIDPVIIADLGGHDLATSEGRYTHSLDDGRQAAAVIEQQLTTNQENSNGSNN